MKKHKKYKNTLLRVSSVVGVLMGSRDGREMDVTNFSRKTQKKFVDKKIMSIFASPFEGSKLKDH